MEDLCGDDNSCYHICDRDYGDGPYLHSVTYGSGYRCGGCKTTLRTICLLHEHLLKEFLLGSYLYDHNSQTAFPKYATVSVETQTEIEQLSISNCDKDDNVVDHITCVVNNKSYTLSADKNYIEAAKRKRKYTKRKPDIESAPFPKRNTRRGHENVSETEIKLQPLKIKKEIGTTMHLCTSILNYTTNLNSESDLQNNDIKEETVEPFYDESTDENIDPVDNHEIDKKVNESGRSSGDEWTPRPKELERDKVIVSTQVKKSKRKKKVGILKSKIYKEAGSKKKYLKATDKKNKKKNSHPKTDANITIVSGNVSSKRTSQRKKKACIRPAIKKENFKCFHCDSLFLSERKFNTHIQLVHKSIYPFACNQCNRKPFRTQQDYTDHKNQHPKLIYNCDLCGKELRSREGLRLHELIHTGKKPYCCDQCDYRGRTSTQLKLHMISHTDTKTEQCELCGKAFFTKGKLKEHLRYCRKEFHHYCPHCQKGFPTASGLRKHILKHTGERAFVCDVCGFATFRTSLLNSHMRTHTGEKRYKCKECGAQLATRGTLLLHLRTHTHEKPFVCSYCTKAFTSKWNLQTHLRQHTGETPYKCNICGQGFKQNVLRKIHMRSHLESTSTEAIPIHQDHLVPIEMHLMTEFEPSSTKQNIHTHKDLDEIMEPAGIPGTSLEQDKPDLSSFIPVTLYDRGSTGDIVHQALESENLHPLDLKLHYPAEQKPIYNVTVTNARHLQSHTFDVINYDLKPV